MPILGIIASSTLVASSSYESIASATGTGSNPTITFSSIPAGYASLQIRALVRDTTNWGTISTSVLNMVINSDTGSNYTWHRLAGTGSAADAGGSINEQKAQTVRCITAPTIGSDIFGAAIIDIHDYASTSKYKTVRSFGGSDGNTANTQFQIQMTSSLWQSTSAITSLSFTANTAWATGTTISLYGIK